MTQNMCPNTSNYTSCTVFSLPGLPPLSPSISFSSVTSAYSINSSSIIHSFGDDRSTDNEFADDGLTIQSPPTPFTFTGWGWVTNNGATIVEFTLRRSRSDSLSTAGGFSTCLESRTRPIPDMVPETLPSLYFGSDAGDEEDEDDDEDLVESRALHYDNAGDSEVQISTFPSLTSINITEAVISSEQDGVTLPGTFDDSEEVDAIIAALRVMEDDNTDTINGQP
ncbi:hypothetical protein M408DRAFT_321757 [Serendipita vermifera MAFF 305830]|uniref:Uncharacterized protein n=1 Tax=Serendipita vermifera MAFF 305830 TaxID=933852 RepID=A0A0C3BF92_SERVB|nr:hypothetical protein M408DRAFT_321757 [Serendipita vermifera MAFF 305830]